MCDAWSVKVQSIPVYSEVERTNGCSAVVCVLASVIAQVCGVNDVSLRRRKLSSLVYYFRHTTTIRFDK